MNIAVMIVIMLFAGGLISSPCSAVGTSNEVRVGSELDFPPYAFADEKGRPAGFSIELIKAVADAMGLSITISTGPWDTVWNDLVAGQIDVLPIVAKSRERRRLVDFSLPHTETYDTFFLRKGDPPIPDIADARGKEIVVMRSDAAHHELLARNFQGKLVLVDTIPEGLSLISSGKHNAFLCSKLIGTLIIKKHGLKNLIAGPLIPDYKRVFSFGVKKGDTELLEKLNQGLLIVKTNREYDRIYDKWLTFDDPWQKARKYLLPAIITLIAVMFIAGLWLVILHLLVRKRTRELAEKNEMLCLAHTGLEARIQERTTELEKANQLLQTQNKTFSQVLNGLDALVYVVDMKTYEIVFINSYGQRIWGDINGKICWQTIQVGPLAPCEFCTNSKLVGPDGNPTEGVVWEFQNTVNERWYDCRDRAIYWPDGRIVRMEIATDITSRKKAEEALRHENVFIEALFESIPGMLYVYDDQGTHIRHNKKHEEMTGYSEEELSHLNPLSWYDDKADIVRVEAAINDVFTSGYGEVDAPMRIKNGEKPFMHFTGSRLIMDGKKYFIGVGIDITERKQAEEKIKTSLLEKETLLKEIHHRVKNNLQVISSLLDLQSSYLQDEKAREMLHNSMDRIKTMARIHTMLYQSEDMRRINFGGFIMDLAGRLQQSYGIAESPVRIDVDVSDVSLTIETSIPCGLILNELVSNALKHAFPEEMFKVQGSRFKAGETGEINIAMKENRIPEIKGPSEPLEPPDLRILEPYEKQFILTISDNGIGFPEKIDFRNTKSLGLELVNLLVGQINGTIDLQADGGTTFTITFPAINGG